MQLFERFWRAVTYVLGIVTLSPVRDVDLQTPLMEVTEQLPLGPIDYSPLPNYAPGPIFKPPGGDGSDFTCDYSNMVGYTQCKDPTDRTCWLTNSNGDTWNITRNYEATFPNGAAAMPNGTVRPYTITVTEKGINADGMNFPYGKTFNGLYPGPLIQACWGDLVEVTVVNQLPYNGTSIHWHGLRQWLSMHMDGVNGITQCPIPPGQNFTYRWNTTQYGSSW